MSEEKQKNREVEWSFSFEHIGESIDNWLESLGISGDTEVKTGHFSETVGGATSARVKLDLSVGEANVKALSGSDNLLEADVTYVGEIELAGKSDGKGKSVRFGQKHSGGVMLKSLKDFLRAGSDRERLRWDVGLSRDLPLDLEINTGVTSDTLDLSELKLTALKVNSGAGKTVLTIPAGESRYSAAASAGVGECNVEVLPGAEIDLRLSTGTGALNVKIGDNAAVDAHISGGVGACSITVPGSAAVRLKASTGLGSVDVPAHFTRVRGGDEFFSTGGTWETPGFSSAARSITIRYDGGIGKLTVRSGPQIV